MWRLNFKGCALFMAGLLFSVVPVSVSVIMCFPLWRELGGEYVFSGVTLLLLIPAMSPIFKAIRQRLKSPASYTVWLILFIVFFALSKIADEMIVISFVGFISNLIGAAFFKLSERCGDRDEA